MANLVNGFDSHEAFQLYSFLCVYENYLNKIRNNTDFEKVFLKHEDLNKHLELLNICVVSKDIIWGVGSLHSVPLKDSIYMTSAGKCKSMALMYHIRNSIAHGQIRKNENKIELCDFSINKGTHIYSAKGSIKYNIFIDMINLINNNIAL